MYKKLLSSALIFATGCTAPENIHTTSDSNNPQALIVAGNMGLTAKLAQNILKPGDPGFQTPSEWKKQRITKKNKKSAAPPSAGLGFEILDETWGIETMPTDLYPVPEELSGEGMYYLQTTEDGAWMINVETSYNGCPYVLCISDSIENECKIILPTYSEEDAQTAGYHGLGEYMCIIAGFASDEDGKTDPFTIWAKDLYVAYQGEENPGHTYGDAGEFIKPGATAKITLDEAGQAFGEFDITQTWNTLLTGPEDNTLCDISGDQLAVVSLPMHLSSTKGEHEFLATNINGPWTTNPFTTINLTLNDDGSISCEAIAGGEDMGADGYRNVLHATPFLGSEDQMLADTFTIDQWYNGFYSTLALINTAIGTGEAQTQTELFLSNEYYHDFRGSIPLVSLGEKIPDGYCAQGSFGIPSDERMLLLVPDDNDLCLPQKSTDTGGEVDTGNEGEVDTEQNSDTGGEDNFNQPKNNVEDSGDCGCSSSSGGFGTVLPLFIGLITVRRRRIET